MKKTNNQCEKILTCQLMLFLFLAVLWCPTFGHANNLNSLLLSSRLMNGVDADNDDLSCSLYIGTIIRSPSHKKMRQVKIRTGEVQRSFLDLDPMNVLHLNHYNSRGWMGYDIWFRNYGTDKNFLRIWMNPSYSQKTPISVELYSESKVTGVRRLIASCINLR